MTEFTANSRSLLIKVPQITAYFWVIKILSTTVGETFADFLNTTLGFGLNGTSIVMFAILAISLALQFRTKQYTPIAYWGTVVLTSIAGTLITDNLTDNLGIPLEMSSIVFAALLTVSFISWKKVEKTVSIHSIDTPRREAFYWTTILLTFALGTATGDLFAEKFDLGYFLSFWIFAAVIAVIFFVMRAKVIGTVLAFWATYVLTRPLGASLGDYLSQDPKVGGLGWGTTITSVVFLAVIASFVGYLSISKRDVISRNL